MEIRSHEYQNESSHTRLKDFIYRSQQRNHTSQTHSPTNTSLSHSLLKGYIYAHRTDICQLTIQRIRYQYQEITTFIPTCIYLPRRPLPQIYTSNQVPYPQQPPFHTHHSPSHHFQSHQGPQQKIQISISKLKKQPKEIKTSLAVLQSSKKRRLHPAQPIRGVSVWGLKLTRKQLRIESLQQQPFEQKQGKKKENDY